jgi:hypothetical protein
VEVRSLGRTFACSRRSRKYRKPGQSMLDRYWFIASVVGPGFEERPSEAKSGFLRRCQCQTGGNILRICKANRYPRDLSDDFRVHPGDETSDLAGREGMGQQPKMLVVQLTPTAALAVAQLDKVDRTVILGTPGAGRIFLTRGLICTKEPGRRMGKSVWSSSPIYP